ncbi:DUF6223 family protein [Streptomyces sp. NBC_00053]|uniref:DUF6223 family protein n=1 Tax=unclassified Streptomyces TaxID=2593676 RepID=UPI000F98E9A0|nr:MULTISPECIES: DUF6223 family protein [unclassified Streptomyces]WSG55447.1 DUF6223 family protein [Streptomyces sp. NBC_01732]WSX06584.1 DUF6223 family protein [Streptomyces sp. NBC_00987]MCX5098244.1 DUF6223 family protein [Streptomyces sp. NBC_00439]MCX5165284.1 DUF6223 family protein [Streptomyces sp. NBC_00305]MCX5223807.1 DUF6223 family protein [Streptomyces sp. NBC_00264]
MAGLIAVGVGGAVAATADGGTGTGLGGAYVAMLMGLVAVTLGWLAPAEVADRNANPWEGPLRACLRAGPRLIRQAPNEPAITRAWNKTLRPAR